MSYFSEVLQRWPQLDDLLEARRVRADLLKVHDGHVTHFHRCVIQLRDHELESPVQVRGNFVE